MQRVPSIGITEIDSYGAAGEPSSCRWGRLQRRSVGALINFIFKLVEQIDLLRVSQPRNHRPTQPNDDIVFIPATADVNARMRGEDEGDLANCR